MCPRRRRLAVVLALGAQTACASLSGLDNGAVDAGADGGHDATSHVDAAVRDAGGASDARDGGHDAAVHDAEARDVAVDRSTVDAPRPGDGGEPRDAETHDAKAHDATDGACSPVVPGDSGAAPACPSAEAGSCAPASLGTFAPLFVPSQVSRGSCTTAQITNLVDTCFGPNSSQSECQTLLASTADETCNACLITGSTASAWGPLIYHSASGYYVANVGGCVDVLAPCQRPCASALQAKQECEFAACEAACPSSVGGFNACTTAAGGCECDPELQAVVDCQNALSVGPQAVCFFDAENFVQAAADFGALFCGPLSNGDGGTDGGG